MGHMHVFLAPPMEIPQKNTSLDTAIHVRPGQAIGPHLERGHLPPGQRPRRWFVAHIQVPLLNDPPH